MVRTRGNILIMRPFFPEPKLRVEVDYDDIILSTETVTVVKYLGAGIDKSD